MRYRQLKKTELIVREDNTIYSEVDYIDDLQLKLAIINGKITEPLYYRNQHGGISRIDDFGCCQNYKPFKDVSPLMFEIVQAQMKKRIKMDPSSHQIDSTTDT